MEIEVKRFYPEHDMNKPLYLGLVEVILQKRLIIHLKVIRSSKRPQRVFCKFPTFKAAFPNSGEFIPWFSWVDDNEKKERQISDEVVKILKERKEIE